MKWILSPVGVGGKLYITAASGKQLQCDGAGAIGLRKIGADVDNKKWLEWSITPAGAGEVFITSWKGKKLTRGSDGGFTISAGHGDDKRWSMTTLSGEQARHLEAIFDAGAVYTIGM